MLQEYWKFDMFLETFRVGCILNLIRSDSDQIQNTSAFTPKKISIEKGSKQLRNLLS